VEVLTVVPLTGSEVVWWVLWWEVVWPSVVRLLLLLIVEEKLKEEEEVLVKLLLEDILVLGGGIWFGLVVVRLGVFEASEVELAEMKILVFLWVEGKPA
jgi:hypothetical protein